MAIVFILMGILAVVIGIVGKEFYVGDDFTNFGFDQKSSTWSGKLIFIGVGLGLFAMGLEFLITGHF